MKVNSRKLWISLVVFGFVNLILLGNIPFANSGVHANYYPNKIESRNNKMVEDGNNVIDKLLKITPDSEIEIMKFSKIKVKKLNESEKIVEIYNKLPSVISYYSDGSITKTYDNYSILVKNAYEETHFGNAKSTKNIMDLSTQFAHNSDFSTGTFTFLGTGSKEIEQASPYGDVTLYVKITYTTRVDSSGFVCSRLDRTYGKLVDLGVTYFRNLCIDAITSGAWDDSASSKGISSTLYTLGGVASPDIGSLYYSISPSSHYYCTETTLGAIIGRVSIEWKHSYTGTWYTYTIVIGEGGWGGVF